MVRKSIFLLFFLFFILIYCKSRSNAGSLFYRLLHSDISYMYGFKRWSYFQFLLLFQNFFIINKIMSIFSNVLQFRNYCFPIVCVIIHVSLNDVLFVQYIHLHIQSIFFYILHAFYLIFQSKFSVCCISC